MFSHWVTTTALWSRLNRCYSAFYRWEKEEGSVLPKVTPLTHECQCWALTHGFFLNSPCFSLKPCPLPYSDCWIGGSKTNPKKNKNPNWWLGAHTNLPREGVEAVSGSPPYIPWMKILGSAGELRAMRRAEWAGHGVSLYAAFVAIHPFIL